MAKIIFMTDIHLRASRPLSRKDEDFTTVQIGKLEEVADIAAAEKADLTICGGDIVDRPDVPHSVIIKAIRAFRKFTMPVYTVAGNHDIFGYSANTTESGAIGVLFESGVVKRLDNLMFNDCNIYGLHAFDDTMWMVPPVEGLRILVAHKMITNRPIPGGSSYLISDVAENTNADVILSGDIHSPHLEKIGGRWFVNPGSLSRLSIVDRERQPQVAILTTHGDHVDIEMRTLSVRPAEVVFDLSSYSQRMAREQHTSDFTKTYVNAIISVKAEADNVGEAMLSFIEEHGPADIVRKHIKAYLSRAQKEVLEEAEE